MKKLLLFIGVFTFCFACKNQTSKTPPEVKPETVVEAAPPVKTPEALEKTTSDEGPKHIKASKDSPLIGFWEVQAVLGVKDQKELQTKLKEHWFNMKADNTFESGIGKNTTNSGTWSYDASLKRVNFVFSKVDIIPPEWELQGGGDQFLWKGNTPKNPQGWQVLVAKGTPPVQ